MTAQADTFPRGIALPELLVALAVAAILTGTAWPLLRDALAVYTVSHAADRLAGSLALARTTAASRRVEVLLQPPTGAESFDRGWQLVEAPGPSAPGDLAAPPFAVVTLDQPCLHISLRGTGGAAGPPTLRLTAVGYSRSEQGGFFAATFQVRCHGAQRQVRLGAQGRIRICRPGTDVDCD
ncbi:type IV fimbrial biogenesis protein FimT [Cupriavidus sp. YR651]|uniref:GspH/FimT family pseudopilin n=1 Tax=Cupriavidus sp. YR651 TaxID=1855315 RepID=UPI00088033EB|nr:GspH/FimT family pseudopilin [Cupriavidus sp. YR651]SDC20600.1 type IV fimbrial biogenesis protein FimT [Cupriavidus sp. YR651]